MCNNLCSGKIHLAQYFTHQTLLYLLERTSGVVLQGFEAQ